MERLKFGGFGVPLTIQKRWLLDLREFGTLMIGHRPLFVILAPMLVLDEVLLYNGYFEGAEMLQEDDGKTMEERGSI